MCPLPLFSVSYLVLQCFQSSSGHLFSEYSTVIRLWLYFLRIMGSFGLCVFYFFPVLNPGRIYQDSRCDRSHVALKKARPLCSGHKLQSDRCGPRIFQSWERVACHLLGLGEGLESFVFAPVSFYARSVSDFGNFLLLRHC